MQFKVAISCHLERTPTHLLYSGTNFSNTIVDRRSLWVTTLRKKKRVVDFHHNRGNNYIPCFPSVPGIFQRQTQKEIINKSMLLRLVQSLNPHSLLCLAWRNTTFPPKSITHPLVVILWHLCGCANPATGA